MTGIRRLAGGLTLVSGMLAGTLSGLPADTAQAATAAPATGVVTLVDVYGFDTCSAPTTSQMTAFWVDTPLYFAGIYIGGVDRSCSQPYLTPSWINYVTGGTGPETWYLLPTWAGPQDPCSGLANEFSTNTSTAYSQGQTQGYDEYIALIDLSINPDAPVTYDMEGFGAPGNATCLDAAEYFVAGWDESLAVPPAQVSGVYGSSASSGLEYYCCISSVPYYIWGADWDGNPDVYDMAGVPTGYWADNQRIKQYTGGHDQTYNGVTLYIDSDYADGPLYYAL